MKSTFTLLVFTGFCIVLYAQSAGDYQTAGSGVWATAATWQTYNGTSWVTATTAPSSANGVITIRPGHIVTIGANVTVDQVVVNGTLRWAAGVLTVANGIGVDLQVNSVFVDSSTSNVSFSSGATWALAANATYIKVRTGSPVNWQNAYQGGISNIPANSNWIVRKNSASNPTFSTAGMYYGNLTFENLSATGYTPPLANTFQGSTGTVTILGDLNVGGNGISAFNMTNNNTFTSPISIAGNFTITSLGQMTLSGEGFAVQGNIVCNGSLLYGSVGNRRISITGSSAQTISGSGVCNLYELIINKPAQHFTLSRPITVDYQLTLINGNLIGDGITSTSSPTASGANFLTLGENATTIGASNNSYVVGRIRKIGEGAFTFPTGKNNYYRPIAMGATTTNLPFWTERFTQANCGQNTQVMGFNSGNGAWTQTNGVNGSTSNRWFVSAKEGGTAVPNTCGFDDCNVANNRTLHVGNDPASTFGFFFCPTGDCGAAYDASTANEITDKRAESPTINCTGRYNIELSFLYIENGEGTNDNATLWYFNGSTWTEIADPPKTPTGSCGVQGQWTLYKIILPASANNNPNVKIGFRWVNDGNGVGSDPSFAVDEINLKEIPVFSAEYFLANPLTSIGSAKETSIHHLSSKEYWYLHHDGLNTPRSVTLSWNSPTPSGSVTNLSELLVCRWDGTIWRNHGQSATTGNTSAGTVTSSGNINTFSPFTLGSSTTNNPLPVKYLYFTTRAVENSYVSCEWATASEIDNEGFEVQRSENGIDFQKIAWVEGHNNKNTTTTYAYNDKSVLKGKVYYYRLRQVDTDGSFALSIISVAHLLAPEIDLVVLYPTPAKDRLHITLPFISKAEVVSIKIFNTLGELVYTQEHVASPGESLSIDVSPFSVGNYTIETIVANRRNYRKFSIVT